MATGFYLLDNPPARSQYRRPRRGTFTGGIGIHTTEGVMDDVGIDTGAENVAAYIVRRDTPGSYHRIVDSDSLVPMLPDNAEAFAIAADGLNRSTVNMAFACRTTDLHPDSPWTRAAFRRMADEIVGTWRRNHVNPLAAARWLTREQVLAGWSGLFHHGTVQPYDRHDAFTRSPHRPALERLLLDEVRRLVAPTPINPPPEELTVADVAAITAAIEAGNRWPYYAAPNGTEWVQVDGRNVFAGPNLLRQWRAEGRIAATPAKLDQAATTEAWDAFGHPKG